YFPDRINTEFIRVVNPSTIKMRVWERGSGETMACGTGACAAVVAAVAAGQCEQGRDITVRVRGGDLVVNYTDEAVTLTGDAKLVYTGTVEHRSEERRVGKEGKSVWPEEHMTNT